ncbi:hypothetical protein BsWGS_25942 [Bradybaena similaris]
MGGIFSQEISPEDDFMKIQDSLRLTPSQRLQNPRLRDVRLLSVDPRSPSDFISRTPIVVEKTPELQTKKMKQSLDARGTSIQGPVIKDPRSPTTEFTRTPINPCLSSSAAIRGNVKAAGHTEEPDTCQLKSRPESASESSVWESLPELSESGEPTSELENPESVDTASLKETPESEDITEQESEVNVEKLVQNVKSHEMAQLKDTDAEGQGDAGYKDDVAGCNAMEVSTQTVDNKLISKVKPVEESTPKLLALIPTTSDNRIRMKPKMLSLHPNVPRSPLCTVQNSPRVLSDRYNLSTNGSKSIHSHKLHDKENVFH